MKGSWCKLFWWSVYHVLKVGYEITILYTWYSVFALLPFSDIKRISSDIKNTGKERRTKRIEVYVAKLTSFKENLSIITEIRYPNSTVQCWMQYRSACYIYLFTSILLSLTCTKFYGRPFRQDHEIYFRFVISIPL